MAEKENDSSSSSVALKGRLQRSIPAFVTPRRKLIGFGTPRLTELTFGLELGKLIAQDFRTDFVTILLPCKGTLLNHDILLSCGQKHGRAANTVLALDTGCPQQHHKPEESTMFSVLPSLMTVLLVGQ